MFELLKPLIDIIRAPREARKTEREIEKLELELKELKKPKPVILEITDEQFEEHAGELHRKLRSFRSPFYSIRTGLFGVVVLYFVFRLAMMFFGE